MKVKVLCPSIMCADFGSFRSEIAQMDAAGIDQYHMDIMDGEFVPNFALSWADFAAVRKMTEKPLDAHLMVKDPSIHLPYAFKYGADIIYVHFESGNAAKHLYEIRKNGRKVGLAINPETSIEKVQTLFPIIDSLLVMRVHPGFSGQIAIPEVEEKLDKLAKIKNRNFSIRLDGCVSPDVIDKWAKLGIEEFVCGTASEMFGEKRGNRSYKEIIDILR